MEDIAQEYITYGRQFVSNNSYSKAFDLYIMAFEKCPGVKYHHEPEFRDVLNRYNEILYKSNKTDEIFKNLDRSLEIYPNNMIYLNELGKYLYKFGQYMEAWSYFQKALKVDSCFVSPEKSLNSIKSLLVPRWHFRMLNDRLRNFAYHEAIKKTIKPFKDSLLDLGLGSCILSVYAYECCPIVTTALKSSEVMVKIIKKITHVNGIVEIIILNQMCNGLNFRDIGGKRSLVVTEMFDAGLFGEQILQNILHSLEHLVSNVGRVLPKQAEFYVAPVQSDLLAMRYKLASSAKAVLNIPDAHVHTLNDEPYDCEDVHNFKDLKYLAEPQLLFIVNFNDIEDIQDKMTRTAPYTTELNITEKGELNNVIGWFTLHLIDNVSITTDPRSKNRATAWQQAVFFHNIPKNVIQGQTVKVDFFSNEGKLTMAPDSDVDILKTSTDVIRFLNDTEYINMITGCLGMASVYLGQIAEMSQINVVDLCPFPIFGLMMLKRGANSLTCYAKVLSDKEFIMKILEANSICDSKVIVLLGNDWGSEVFGQEKYHAIFVNFLELSGDIDIRFREIAHTLRQSHLTPGGLYMPADVKVIAQLVASRWLDVNNKVYDENIGNYEVAKHLNSFQVSQNFFVDLNHLEYKALTGPVVFGSYDSETRSQVANVPITHTGASNALICWYNIELMKDMHGLPTKRPGAYIDGIVFVLSKKLPVLRGNVTTLLRCTDPDGSFKIMIDGEAT